MDLFYTAAPEFAQLKVTCQNPPVISAGMRELLAKINSEEDLLRKDAISLARATDRLRRLRIALTEKRQVSYYASISEEEAKTAVELIDLIVPPPILATPKLPQRKRQRKPVELDLSLVLQSDLFADLNRWPRKPYCTDDLAAGLKIRNLVHALRQPYIQANPPWMRVWAIFDIDRPGAAGAWEAAELPPPAWTSINRENGHAHSAWGLRAPVLVQGVGIHAAPLRYLCAVESMMREKLQADHGYSGLITKNPAHPLWHTLRGPRISYDLAELAQYLPGLEKHIPRRHKPEEVGLGRNVSLFDSLRKWSYTAIRRHWDTDVDEWFSEVNSRALVMNADFRTPLDGSEVWHIAKSVAKWSMNNLSKAGFSAWQAEMGGRGGKASGISRRQASEEARATARLLSARGLSSRQIAGELEVDQSTVLRWLRG